MKLAGSVSLPLPPRKAPCGLPCVSVHPRAVPALR